MFGFFSSYPRKGMEMSFSSQWITNWNYPTRMTQYTDPSSTIQYNEPNTLRWSIIKKAWVLFAWLVSFFFFFSRNPFWTFNSELQENKSQLNTTFLETFKETVSKTGLELWVSSPNRCWLMLLVEVDPLPCLHTVSFYWSGSFEK